MSDLISIVIPVYNLGDLVYRLNECLLKQTYDNYEAIFVDDGSRDDSLDYLKKVEELNNKIKVISQQNQGAGAARNTGIKAAKGKYICFVDGDDWIADDYLEKLRKTIAENDADLVFCNYYSVDYHDNQKVYEHSFDLTKKCYNFPEDLEIINNIGNAPWNKIYLLEKIVENEILFPVGYRHHDMVFVQRYLLHSEKVCYCNEYLNYYLMDRPDNISSSYDSKIDHILYMLELLVADYKSSERFEICYNEVMELCLNNLILSLRKLNYMKNSRFTFDFIDRSFEFIRKYFADYKKSVYYQNLDRNDKVYLNKNILKLYQVTRKRK